MTKKISEEDIKNLESILEKKLFTDLIGEKPTELKNNLQAGTLQNYISKRLYYLNEVVDALRGAYNEEGIRRWFYRERTQLEWKNPSEYLGQDWKPDDENAKKVLELAKLLNV